MSATLTLKASTAPYQEALHFSHQRYLAVVHLALPQTPTRPNHMIRRECTTLPGPCTSTWLISVVSPIATWRHPLAILFFPSLQPRCFSGLSQHDSTSAAPSHPSSWHAYKHSTPPQHYSGQVTCKPKKGLGGCGHLQPQIRKEGLKLFLQYKKPKDEDEVCDFCVSLTSYINMLQDIKTVYQDKRLFMPSKYILIYHLDEDI